MTSEDGQNAPGLGELSRQVRDVLIRFSELATRLENQFVRDDIFKLYKESIDRELRRLISAVDEMEDKTEKLPSTEGYKALEGRVAGLEDALKWVVRAVIGFVILGVLAAVIKFGNPPGSP